MAKKKPRGSGSGNQNSGGEATGETGAAEFGSGDRRPRGIAGSGDRNPPAGSGDR